jgi:hypothetical protein
MPTTRPAPIRNQRLHANPALRRTRVQQGRPMLAPSGVAIQATGPPRSDAGVGIGMLMGDLLTFGYLMLYDALGFPYFRLFNGNP